MSTVGVEWAGQGRWSVAGWSDMDVLGNRPFIKLASGGRELRKPGAYPVHPKLPNKWSMSAPGLSHPRRAGRGKVAIQGPWLSALGR